MDINCQTCPEAEMWAALGIQPKESKLKLSLETRQRGEVVIVHCEGRIVYRDEASALSSVVSEALERQGKVVLDLSGVSAGDSTGARVVPSEFVKSYRLTSYSAG